MLRVSAALAVPGVKLTVMVQVAAGARVAQVEAGMKLGVVTQGVAIWRVAVPVFLRVMVCCVAVLPGTLLKMRALGVRERPGSGAPNPARGATTLWTLVWMVRVPVSVPAAVGV